jgi:hypothetical protein
MVVLISPHLFNSIRFVYLTVSRLHLERLAYTTAGRQVHKILKKRNPMVIFFLFDVPVRKKVVKIYKAVSGNPDPD